jgi:23S rRNA (guanosine2251-2'-O)-methyltransferase
MKRILAGPHAVSEALKNTPKAIEVICIAESMRPSSVRRIEDLAHRARVTVEIMPKSSLDQLAKELKHQGVIAITGSFPYMDMDGLFAKMNTQKNPLLVALDQVQDPRNLGAIMRSAHVFGASGLIIPKNRSARVTESTVRASAGASELVPTVLITNLVRTLDELRDQDFQVFGTALNGKTPLKNLSWEGRTVLVLGNEGKGLRRLTMEHCDVLFTIPMANDFDSLNVSAAASIALYEAAGQRFASNHASKK